MKCFFKPVCVCPIYCAEPAELFGELSLCSRTVFGMEPSQLSFLYFLMYSAAAGGVMRLLETTPGCAQEFKVKVRKRKTFMKARIFPLSVVTE